MNEPLRKLTEKKLNTPEHELFKGVRSEIDDDGERRVSAPADTHIVVSKTQIEAGKKRKERDAEYAKNQENQQAFTFTDMEAIKEVSAVLTTQQCGLLLMLQCFITYDTGLIVKVGKKPMNQADMSRKLNVSRQTISDILRTCEEHGIIFGTDIGYIVNQRYHFKGSTDNPKVIRTYIARLREVYDEIKPVDLGLIYRMLPYAHLTTNFIVMDPFARPEEVDVMGRDSLSAAVGIAQETLSRRMRRMRFGEEYVFARITVGDHTGYALNPSVFWRGGKRPDDTLIAMFAVKPKRKRK